MKLSAQLGGIGENILQSMTGRRFWSPETGQHEHLRELLNLLTTVARNEGDDGLSSWSKVFNIDLVSFIVSGSEIKILALMIQQERSAPAESRLLLNAPVLQR